MAGSGFVPSGQEINGSQMLRTLLKAIAKKTGIGVAPNGALTVLWRAPTSLQTTGVSEKTGHNHFAHIYDVLSTRWMGERRRTS